MTHVILVHGYGANKSSWAKIPGELTKTKHTVKAKHTVDAENLLGHNDSLQAPADTDVTLQEQVDDVFARMPKIPCTLIGHSMGGMVISQIAADFPDRVERLIYVAAMLPKDRETAQEIIDRAKITGQKVIEEFSNKGPDALKGLSRQPTETPKGAFTSSPAFKSVERHYIRCDDDGILPPGLQDEMIDEGKPISVVDLNSDHLPQFSVPEKLKDALLKILG